MRSMFDIRHDLAPRGTIGAQLVGDHPLWCYALLLQKSGQQAFGGLSVATGLHDLVENTPILIDSPPQPMLLAGNAHNNFIKMPYIMASWLFAPEPTRILRAELPRPATYRFVGDDDATFQ